MRTLKPICYTSANSVFQIAAHEEAFGLERLYEVCRIARRLCDPLAIGRVIARPFVGRDRRRFRPHRQSQGFLDSAAARQSARSARSRRGARSSRSARSATSSPIASPAARSRAATTPPTSTSRSCAARDRRRRLHLRQPGRFRQRIRPPPRRPRLRRLPRGVRRAAAGDRSGDARRRFLRADRRPRQRSDLARQRPHPRARADPRLRRRRRAGADRRAREPRRHRRDRRAEARPAGAGAAARVGSHELRARPAPRRRHAARSATSRCRARC